MKMIYFHIHPLTGRAYFRNTLYKFRQNINLDVGDTVKIFCFSIIFDYAENFCINHVTIDNCSRGRATGNPFRFPIELLILLLRPFHRTIPFNTFRRSDFLLNRLPNLSFARREAFLNFFRVGTCFAGS